MVRNVNKLSALCTDPVCFSFRSLLELAEVIFSSKSLKKSSIKLFPFNFQLSDDFCEVFGRKSRICFSIAMSNGRFPCLLKYLSELSITKSNLVWFSWPLFDFAEIFTSRSWGSPIGLAGCRIWLFFVVIFGIWAKKKGWEAGISVASGSGISCFYRVGMRDWQGKQRDTGFQFQRDYIIKPEVGENEPFVRIQFMNSRT